MPSFLQQLKAATEQVLSDIDTKIYEISWELFSSIVAKSPSPSNPGPHAKGLLSDQWYPAIGGFSSALGSSISNTGADSLSRIRAMLNGKAFSGKDNKFTLSNSVPYALQAEDDGWPLPKWTGKPPYRMVALSLQAVAAKYTTVRL